MSAKRHHYLPQFYLERFVLPDETTFLVYDKAGGPPRRQTPVNTGVEGHLYTLLDADGKKYEEIETDVFAPLDGLVAPIFTRILDEGEHPSREDQETLAGFIAASHTRTPRQIGLVQELGGAAVAKRMVEDARDPEKFAKTIRDYNATDPEMPVDDIEEFRKTILRLPEDFSVRMDRQSSMIQSIQSSKDIASELLQMDWAMMEADTGEHYVVGDAPVTVLAQNELGQSMLGAGFGLPNAEVAFPLDPTRCLYIGRNLPGLHPPVEEFNARMVCQADRFIVSSVESDAISELVREFSHTLGRSLLDHEEIFGERPEVDRPPENGGP